MSERDNDSREPGVHRLVDMVVEEVSLVDRAANKRRYLLVKRSDDVAGTDNTETDTEADADDINADPDTSETDDEDAEDEGEDADETSDDEKPSATDTGAANAAVVAALEAMSAAVETLATAQAKAIAPPKKPSARGGGSTAAEDDDETDEDEDDDETDEDEDEDAPPPRRPKRAPKRQEKGDAAVAEMKAAIKRLEGLVGGRPRQGKRAAAPLDDVTKKLDTVTATLADLKKLIGGQGERIGRVEKSVGLPASWPVEGKGKKKGVGDTVSWPFDLNTSVDRASVDKSVSFHD